MQEFTLRFCVASDFEQGFIYLKYNLLHLLIRGLELSDEDQHHLPGVIVSVLSIHQWDQVTDSFQESCQTLETDTEE